MPLAGANEVPGRVSHESGWLACMHVPLPCNRARTMDLAIIVIRAVGNFHSDPVPCRSMGFFHSYRSSNCPWYRRCHDRDGFGSFGPGCLDPCSHCHPFGVGFPFGSSRSYFAFGPGTHGNPCPVLDSCVRQRWRVGEYRHSGFLQNRKLRLPRRG